MKRSTTLACADQCALRNLIATFLPMMGWTPAYTSPIPPSPIFPVTTYSPIRVPVSIAASGTPHDIKVGARVRSGLMRSVAAPYHGAVGRVSWVLVTVLAATCVAFGDEAEGGPSKQDLERARQAYAEAETAYRLSKFDEAAKKYEEA